MTKQEKERKVVVDFLRFMADSQPPAELVAVNPLLGNETMLQVGRAMLRSCALSIEQGVHMQLAEEAGFKID